MRIDGREKGRFNGSETLRIDDLVQVTSFAVIGAEGLRQIGAAMQLETIISIVSNHSPMNVSGSSNEMLYIPFPPVVAPHIHGLPLSSMSPRVVGVPLFL